MSPSELARQRLALANLDELDASRLEDNLGRLLAVHPEVRARLDEVAQFLAQASVEQG